MYRCFLWMYCPFSGIQVQECNCWIIWSLHIEFLKKLRNCFPEWLYHFTFLPRMCEWHTFSTSLPAFGDVTCFYYRHSVRCVVMSHCGFKLLSLIFPSVEYLHVLIWQLYILFQEIFVHFFCQFSNWIVFRWILKVLKIYST